MTSALLALTLGACYPAAVVSVADGDTLTARLEVVGAVVIAVPELRLDTVVRVETTVTREIRIADLRAPERSQPCGPAATAELRRIIEAAEVVEICPLTKSRGKRAGQAVETFGRVIADVRADGLDVASAMVAAGVAGRGKAEGWPCR